MSSLLPRYTHIVNPRLKHTYLSFDDEGELVIRSPKVSQRYIETLLLKKAAWIERAREETLSKKGRADTIRENGYFYLLGKPYTLRFEPSNSMRAALIRQEDSTFLFRYTYFDHDRCLGKIEAFYKQEIARTIPPLIDRWSDLMGVSPLAIRYRKTRRQWGSCSTNNTLSFNTMLMKVPIEAIEYVVVHELAHIIHKHHQPAFWKLVSKHLPDYKARQDLLRQFTPA